MEFMLIVLSGASGAGKNTVIEHLLKTDKFAIMPTYTTRAPRPNETEGHPYCFLNNEQFEQKIKENELYEYQFVHSNYYGTSKLLLANARKSGKILVKDIDVLGTPNFVNAVSADIKIVTVFLKVGSKKILRERLTDRGEKQIKLRLERYEMEQRCAVNYDYVIANDDLDKTLSIVHAIVEHELSGSPLLLAKQPKFEMKKSYEKAKMLLAGEKIKPVKVAVVNGEIALTEGLSKLVASAATGKPVAKEFTDAPENAVAAKLPIDDFVKQFKEKYNDL
ncbi:MAG: hypothetical protein J5762_01720 [Clostridia bacterium]|nr:hypothetical protein [Clostridia bacterium]